MRETELTEIGRELAKYFDDRPGDGTWDGFGIDYSVRGARTTDPGLRLVTPTSPSNVRYITDYVAVIDEQPAPFPPCA